MYHLISDIHLELYPKAKDIISKEIVKDKILLLAGDIGNPSSNIYKTFITDMSNKYEKVFIVTGNHEYYQKYEKKDDINKYYRYDMDQVDNMINKFVLTLSNVHFLQRQSFIHNEIRYLGCTLWSLSDSILSKYMSDYEYIKDFTTKISNNLFVQNVEWLRTELNKESDAYYATVVITHHLPSNKLIHKQYEEHPLNSFFASNLDELVEKADLWVCGHSHTSNYIKIGKCKCYMNPIGYSSESSGFNPNLTIDLL